LTQETPNSETSSTHIAPGKIVLQSGIVLEDWTYGDDITTINGGSIMTNDVLPDNNPKSAHGIKKAPTLSVIPASAILVLGQVMALGSKKYGRFNYREKSVAASVYVDAMLRHLIAWNAGQDTDEESGVSHLGHVLACAAILLDAQGTGNLVDDRSKNELEKNLLSEFTKA
jgi:hypothetical protein